MKPLRVYADTSVFGGSLDAEFAIESQRFFDLVRAGRVKILVSEVVVRELAKAPVRELLRSLPADSVEQVLLTRDVIDLRDAYFRFLRVSTFDFRLRARHQPVTTCHCSSAF